MSSADLREPPVDAEGTTEPSPRPRFEFLTPRGADARFTGGLVAVQYKRAGSMGPADFTTDPNAIPERKDRP